MEKLDSDNQLPKMPSRKNFARQAFERPVTEEEKEIFRNLVGEVRESIGKEPSFDDIMRYMIEKHGYKKMEDQFNGFEMFLKAVGIDTSKSYESYDKFFNAENMFADIAEEYLVPQEQQVVPESSQKKNKEISQEEISFYQLLVDKLKPFVDYVIISTSGNYSWFKMVHIKDFCFSLIPSIIVLYLLRNEVLIIGGAESKAIELPMKRSILGTVICLLSFLCYKLYCYLKVKKTDKI